MNRIVKFIAKWITVFIVVSVLVFSVSRMVPGSPVDRLLAAHQLPKTEENVQALERAWGLDRSVPEQYFCWITNFIKGDWGKSMETKRDIKEEFISKLPYSLTIGMGGIVISAFVSFFLGYLAALKDDGIADKVTRFLSLFALTVPSFIMSVIIIYFVGVKLKLTRFFMGNGVSSVIVATLLIAFYLVGRFSRIVKAHFREQMNQSYIKFAISRGFDRKWVLLKYGYKPVLYGLLSVVISNFAWVLGGSSVLEFAFGIPGISYFLISSLKANDYYVIQSYIMVIVIWMFFVHLVFNEILRVLDVRERR